jgi:release factor glutamine methyltransferase
MIEYSETVPMQYQQKKAKFMGLDIFVDERVFIPRPETELLVKTVSDKLILSGKRESSVLELCTGSGAVSIAIARKLPGCFLTAIDISRDALEVALKNIRQRDMEKRIVILQSDMYESLERVGPVKYDCIAANPPYVSESDYEKVDAWVKAEPGIALLAGKKGLDCIERVIKGAGKYLLKRGFLVMEIGYDQAAEVKALFGANGFSEIKTYRDFNGYERVIAGWLR